MDSPPTSPKGPPKPDADGNYGSPALSALSRVWEDYCEEIASVEDVIGVIAEVGNFAHFQLRNMEEQVEKGLSNPDNEAFSLIFEAFEILLEGCEFMALEFAPEIPEDLEEPEEGFFLHGYDLVQEATNQMMAGHKIGMEHIEAMAEVSCPFCAQINTRGTPKCDKCGRSLPSSDQEAGQSLNLVERQGLEGKQSGAERELTKNFAMTAHLLEGWKAGAVGVEELSRFLDDLQANFLAHLHDTEQQEQMIGRAPESQQPILKDSLEMTRQGLEMSLQSLEKMRLAFENEDDRYLFFGLADLEEASKVLVQAYWENKKAAKL